MFMEALCHRSAPVCFCLFNILRVWYQPTLSTLWETDFKLLLILLHCYNSLREIIIGQTEIVFIWVFSTLCSTKTINDWGNPLSEMNSCVWFVQVLVAGLATVVASVRSYQKPPLCQSQHQLAPRWTHCELSLRPTLMVIVPLE